MPKYNKKLVSFLSDLLGIKEKSTKQKIRRAAKTGKTVKIDKPISKYRKAQLNRAVKEKAAEIAAIEEKKRLAEIESEIESDDLFDEFDDEQREQLDYLQKKLTDGKQVEIAIRAAFDYGYTERKNKVRRVQMTVRSSEIKGLIDVWGDEQATADYLANETREGAFMDGAKVHSINSIEIVR